MHRGDRYANKGLPNMATKRSSLGGSPWRCLSLVAGILDVAKVC